MSGRRWTGELSLGLGVIVLGLLLLAGTRAIPAAGGYERIGPAAYPWVISVGLIVIGCILARTALQPAGGGAGQPRLRAGPPAFIVLGLVLHLLLIEPAGFVIASSLLFACTALAFGTRHRLLTVAIGVGLALAAWVAFARGLGLELPPGILGEAL